jgi:signal transduction histidine kinase
MNHIQFAPNPDNMPLFLLGYSLLIILVCAAAVVKIFIKWQRGRFTQGYRMLQGLLGLLILRMAVFLITYLSWRTGPSMYFVNLPLELAASVTGVILIAWMWNFPERSRGIDLTVLALMVLTASVVVLQMSFMPSLLDSFLGSSSFWQGITISLTVIGCGLILIRKPNYWHYGLFMLGILGIGSALSLIGNSLEILQLSQLVAYPLLLVIGDRFPIGDSQPVDQENDGVLDRKHFSVEHDILKIIYRLFDEKDSTGILYKIAQTTAYLILADLTMVIDTPDEHGKIRIIAGYDLIREEPLQAITLESKSIPLIANYIQRGKMLHIPASSTSRDLSHLSKMLQLSKPGHLLASPVYVPGANKTIGVVLFSPFSSRPWTKEDQDYIQLLCKLFEEAFSHHLVSQNGESEGIKDTIRELSSKLTQLGQDKQQLREDMAVLSKEHQHLLLDQNSLQKKYSNLMAGANALQRHLAMLVDLSKKESTEALRKYITVIEKEIAESGEGSAYLDPEMAAATVALEQVPEKDADPDSTRPADITEAIQNCLDLVKEDIDHKDLAATLDLPEDPPLLKMNHALFREIFSFLVSNAVTENEDGGEINIRVQIYEEDHTQRFAHIKITDQGGGYYPDEIAGILNDHLTTEQQDQLSQVMTNLYVTKNLVENEGGRMWVESTPGTGTTVSLLLAFL